MPGSPGSRTSKPSFLFEAVCVGAWGFLQPKECDTHAVTGQAHFLTQAFVELHQRVSRRQQVSGILAPAFGAGRTRGTNTRQKTGSSRHQAPSQTAGRVEVPQPVWSPRVPCAGWLPWGLLAAEPFTASETHRVAGRRSLGGRRGLSGALTWKCEPANLRLCPLTRLSGDPCFRNLDSVE